VIGRHGAGPGQLWTNQNLYCSTPISNYYHRVYGPLWNRAGHYIFILFMAAHVTNADINIFLPCSFFLSFFLALSQRPQSGCLPYFHTWCGPSAHLECRSKCTARGSLKYRTQKIAKTSPSRHHRTTLSGCIFSTKAYIDSRKNMFNSNISSTCPDNMAKFSPLAAEISSGDWGTPADFNGFRVCLRCCSDVAHRRPTRFCLVVSWAGTLCVHFGSYCPLTEFCHVQKFPLRPRLSFS